LRRSLVAKKGYQKMTPDERARQIRNEQELERLLQRRLERDGTTLEEIHRRLGLPDPPSRH
jgi:hypothetical protein